MEEAMPHHLAPNGFLVALLHLCAVAGAPPGGVVGIDEMENSLHPFAIRRLISIFRDEAEVKDLTVVMATHSPVALDEFAAEPDQIFVMEPGSATCPVPLTHCRDEDWLRHFSLGELYSRLDYGAPKLKSGSP
jgi:AAA15 family ATPase/GTPase